MELKTRNRIEDMVEKHTLTLSRIKENTDRVAEMEHHSDQDQPIKKNITNNK